MHGHEVYAHEMHGHDVYAHEMHIREIHALETHAYEIDALGTHSRMVLGDTSRSPTLQAVVRWSICRDLGCKIRV